MRSEDLNSDQDPEIRSSQDYWQEIEPKRNRIAKLLDFSQTEKKAKNEISEQLISASNENQKAKIPKKIENEEEKKAQLKKMKLKEIDEKEMKKKQPKMIELKELEKRIESIKKSHELELKNIETMAKFMAVEFFNKKGEEINRLYSNEVMEVYKAYDDIRVKFFNDEKKIA